MRCLLQLGGLVDGLSIRRLVDSTVPALPAEERVSEFVTVNIQRRFADRARNLSILSE